MSPRTTLAACALALLAGAAHAQEPVVLDGRFDEWSTAPLALDDPADAPAPYADVRGVKVRFDGDAVYFMLTLEREVALQAMPGTLLLLLDWPADPDRGWEAYGMRGVDLALEFSPELEGGMRAGIMLRGGGKPATALQQANAIGVVSAPTHASRHFELRFRRGHTMAIANRLHLRLVSLDSAGAVVDETAVAYAGAPAFGTTSPRPGRRGGDPLARAPGTDLRVVSWNVGRQDLFTRPDGFGAVLRPLAPDLLVFDEVAGGHSAEEVEALLNRILPGGVPWRAVYGVSGGSQRGVIAVRGAAPRLVAPFDAPIPYPDSTRGIIPADASADLQGWLRNRLESNVPATGALVTVGGRTLLVVTVDLEGGGGPGSPRDRLRIIEANAIRDATGRAARGVGCEVEIHGLLVAGDVNLVGSRTPLDVLMQPDIHGSPLESAQPLRLDGTSAATWEDSAQPFTPSRLDYVLHHPELTTVAGGFVFRAADLSPGWRQRHGLEEDASRVTDHLPLVTDLRWVDR